MNMCVCRYVYAPHVRISVLGCQADLLSSWGLAEGDSQRSLARLRTRNYVNVKKLVVYFDPYLFIIMDVSLIQNSFPLLTIREKTFIINRRYLISSDKH